MEHTRRLQRLWSWLPAFRAVAETEHLPSAAAQLFLTPPALSRSIRLLEQDLGQPLFDRIGRRVRLNGAGRELLRALREAMRRLDDAVQTVTNRQLAGPVHVAAPMPFLSLLVLPALEQLQGEHSALVPHLSSCTAALANARLLDGQLDLALLENPIPHDELTVERVMRMRHGLYCGPGHPLHQVLAPTLEQILAHAFVATDADDHWPVELERAVTLRLAHVHLGVEACAGGRYLATLPELVAQHHPVGGLLRRLPLELIADTALYALRRRSLVRGNVQELILAAVMERSESLMRA